MNKQVILAIVIMTCSFTMRGQVINLSGSWKFRVGDELLWAEKGFDASGWSSIKVPGKWEDAGFHGYDGYAWYRTSFNGNALQENKRYFLNLGYIDDVDEVYVNGNLIGFSGSMPPRFRTAYNAERNYLLPPGIVKKGENVIAIRVFDATLEGGIVDGNIGIFEYESSDRSPLLVNLSGIWDFKKVRSNRPATDDEWDKIMAPGKWENLGHRRYDGYAWYRKSFSYQPEFDNEELVLLAGKIDDFDEVYLNGKLIGYTNDGASYGFSRSFLELRVYTIPKFLLRKNQDNVIEILVEDMGNDGGIYEGPLGITTKSRYNRYFR